MKVEVNHNSGDTTFKVILIATTFQFSISVAKALFAGHILY